MSKNLGRDVFLTLGLETAFSWSVTSNIQHAYPLTEMQSYICYAVFWMIPAGVIWLILPEG